MNVVVVADMLGQISKIKEGLEKAGMVIQETFDAAGVIIGSIDPTKLEEARAVPDVLEIEEVHDTQLAPPDSDTQ